MPLCLKVVINRVHLLVQDISFARLFSAKQPLDVRIRNNIPLKFCRAKLSRSVSVLWSMPQSDFYKLNIDGSSVGTPNSAGCGGLVQDNSGVLILGFAKGIGFKTSLGQNLWLYSQTHEACLMDKNIKAETK
ncbi:hypothetical protein ACH5RR_013374 [Cinchona calisaya]|uniref:Uncharacterized protein n=1 Tax=Cinchona calisaya TaxID=153742 RepID=A0ABD3A3H7_9GENT